MTADVTVRTGAPADASAAAALHSREIADGFLASLGERFLARLYRRVARRHDAFLLIADDDRGRPVGFAAVTEDTRRFYRAFLWRDGVPGAVLASSRLLASLPRALETLRYGTGRSPSGGGDSTSRAEVLAVAVSPEARGRGVGSALVGAATTELTKRRIASVRVVTGDDNRAALALYRSCGFRPSGAAEIHRGHTSQVLTWS
jgi:ribosomal protein S18 acetylase RimI-like enzyme